MQNQENYKNYSVQNFICDEFFQDCVLHPNQEKDEFWQDWISANPDKQAEVEEAVLILKNLQFRNDRPGRGRAEACLEKAWQFIRHQEDTESQKLSNSAYRTKRLWKVAAVGIVLIGMGWSLQRILRETPAPVLVTTSNGELDSVYLPDRSLVVINANSSIHYAKNWAKDKPREVWLNGEALFQVQHLNQGSAIKPNERFLVHVGKTTVEVLGTIFDIRQRREKIEVALLQGSIRLHFDQQARPDIQMMEGDLVVIDTLFAKVKKSRAKTALYAGWTKKKLRLNNPTLSEIVHYLEDIYGQKIVLGDPGLASRKIEGPIMLDSLDDAMFIISTVLNVKIIKDHGILIIKPL